MICIYRSKDIHKYLALYLFIFFDSWKIFGTITKITQIELSESILIKLIEHFNSVPYIASDMSEALHRINLYCNLFSFFRISFFL